VKDEEQKAAHKKKLIDMIGFIEGMNQKIKTDI